MAQRRFVTRKRENVARRPTSPTAVNGRAIDVQCKAGDIVSFQVAETNSLLRDFVLASGCLNDERAVEQLWNAVGVRPPAWCVWITQLAVELGFACLEWHFLITDSEPRGDDGFGGQNVRVEGDKAVCAIKGGVALHVCNDDAATFQADRPPWPNRRNGRCPSWNPPKQTGAVPA